MHSESGMVQGRPDVRSGGRCTHSEARCAATAGEALKTLSGVPILAMAYCPDRDRVVWANTPYPGPLGHWATNLLRSRGSRGELFPYFRRTVETLLQHDAQPEPFLTVVGIEGGLLPVEARMRFVDRGCTQHPDLVSVLLREVADLPVRDAQPFEWAALRALTFDRKVTAVVSTTDLTITWATPATEQRYGASAIGVSLLDLCLPADHAAITDLARAALQRGGNHPAMLSTLPSGRRVHVLDRTDDASIRGLLWWCPADEHDPTDLERLRVLEQIVANFSTELSWGGFARTGGSMVPVATFQSSESLTAREREILDLLATGLRVPSIATRLYISPSTVRNHLSTAFKKIGVASQADFFERFSQRD